MEAKWNVRAHRPHPQTTYLSASLACSWNVEAIFENKNLLYYKFLCRCQVPVLTSDNFLAYLRYLSENQVLVHTNSEESCTKIWKTDNNHRIFAMSKDNNDRK